jgi:hypothetical protein
LIQSLLGLQISKQPKEWPYYSLDFNNVWI